MTGEMLLAERFVLREVLGMRPGVRMLRCHDQQRDAAVLLAEIETTGADAQRTITTLVRQVRAITHDRLVALVDYVIQDDRVLLVADDPGGQTLASQLRSGPIAEEAALTQVIALLHTIETLQTQKPPLLLGELMPDSILVLPTGDWRLLPFGLASPLTRDGTLYRAPELDDAEPTPASDLYGLSAVLHEALTGSPPRTVDGKLTSPRAIRPEISPLAEQALLRGLQTKTANRYQVAREMRLTLETVRMMAGRSLGLGPDVTTSSATIAATPTPIAAPTSQPVTFEVPTVSTAPQVVPPTMPTAAPVPAAPIGRSPVLTGCLIGAAILLALAAFAICALLALFAFGPLRSVVPAAGTAAGVPTRVPTTAPDTTPQPAPTTIGGARPTPITALSANAITLASAATITQTGAITASVFGPVAFTADGATLAVGVGNRISLVDPTTLSERAELPGHTGAITSLAFASDGAVLASGASDEATIYLWDSRTGAQLRALTGHDGGWTRSLAFSPDGSLLVSGGTDETVRVWDVASGTLRQTLRGHTGFVGGVVFSPDGTRVASASRDGTVRLWDVASGTAVADFTFETPTSDDGVTRYWTTGLAFAPNGETIAVGATNNSVYLIDAATGAVSRELLGHNNWVVIRGVIYTTDGRLLTAALDGTIRIWDAATGTEIAVLEQHRQSILGITVSADGTRMASTSDQEGRMLLWDLTQRAPINSLRVGLGMPTGLTFSPDNVVLATTGYNGASRLQVLGTDQNRLLVGSTSSVQSVAFLPEGRLVTLTDQGTIALIDVPNDSQQELAGLAGVPLAVMSATGGSFVAAGDDAGNVVLWDATTGASRATFDTDLTLISRLAISSDGRLLAVSGAAGDAAVEVWDTSSGQRVNAITVTGEAITGLVFQPGQPRLAISSKAGVLRVVGAADGSVLQTLTAASDQGWFAGADFSPDGTLIATATPAGALQLWDAATGAELARVEAPSGLTAVAFAPDGASIAVGGRNGLVYQYGLPGS